MCSEAGEYTANVVSASQTYPFADAGITAEEYPRIGLLLQWKQPDAVESGLLLAVAHESSGQPVAVAIDTNEFTAVCPWTGLPDTGEVRIHYTPRDQVLELKALKFYLLSYRDVGIIQEDAANRMLFDLVSCCRPQEMSIILNYNVRGGLHTEVVAHYDRGDFGMEWEGDDAENRR